MILEILLATICSTCCVEQSLPQLLHNGNSSNFRRSNSITTNTNQQYAL